MKSPLTQVLTVIRKENEGRIFPRLKEITISVCDSGWIGESGSCY